jgi:uncharacterized Zn finger protein (UPF0148 family)
VLGAKKKFDIAATMSQMSSDSSTRIRDAASLLIKGGTLTSDACEKCGGVMVRFGEKTTCVGCGFSKTESVQATEGQPAKTEESQPSDLQSSIEIIRQKIIRLASDIGGESDIMVQKQKAELMETYLRILERLRAVSS